MYSFLAEFLTKYMFTWTCSRIMNEVKSISHTRFDIN